VTVTPQVSSSPDTTHDHDRPAEPWWRGRSVELLAAGLILVVVLRLWLPDTFASARLGTWTTIFVSTILQATPFLVFGVALSACIAVFVPPSFFAKVLPKHPALAVPVAGMGGAVLPGCECGSVPVAGALVRRGVAPAAAFTFLLAAPAINPIVLTATAVAFPNNPEMVAARFLASIVTAVAMGWLWLRLGRTEWIKLPGRPEFEGMSKWHAFWRVTFPLILPGVISGALLAFTLSLDDYIVTFFNNGVGTDTLPLFVYGSLRQKISPEINALSTLMLIASMLLVGFSLTVQNRSASRR